MSKYVEKCARALFAVRYWPGYEPGSYTDRKWDEADPSVRDECLRDARVVLLAGRLSECDAAVRSLMDNGCGDLYRGGDDDRHTARSWLREAEDAALGKER